MTKPIRIIAGLGNPEDKYERTLHNVGFWFVDELARKYGGSFRYERKFDADYCRINLHGEDVWLVKPQSYMNCSGQPIRAVLDYYRLRTDELLVAHDEIDLPPGTVRLKAGGGHGGHNGLRDTIRHCGAEFLRLRLGVGHPGEKHKVTGHVLRRGSTDTEVAVERNIDDAVAVMPDVVDGNINAAMKKLHTQDKD
jgi:PTH1 family peptidyl-tRNA hydrolase